MTFMHKPPQRMDMVETELKSITEVSSKIYNIFEDGYTTPTFGQVERVEAVIKQDRASLHTSLVAAVEGLKKQESPLHDAHQFYQVRDYNQALTDTLTIINSIFKE